MAIEHSPLHKGNTPELQFCWCMCIKCWLSYGLTRDGDSSGKCICPDCPCNKQTPASLSPSIPRMPSAVTS